MREQRVQPELRGEAALHLPQLGGARHARVQRARALDLAEGDNGEDVALGCWLSRLSVNITYVSVGRAFPNLGCLKNQGLYRHPTNGSRGLHFVKKPQGMAYRWETLVGRRPHNRKRCNRMAGVG